MANGIQDDQIADGAVGTDQLASNAVTEAKIATNAVTSDKIADGAITAGKLAEGVGGGGGGGLSGLTANQYLYATSATEAASDPNLTRDANGNHIFSKRIQGKQGADQITLNTLTLGNDGNFFKLTIGLTAIIYIAGTDWQAGSRVVLWNATGGNITLQHDRSPLGPQVPLWTASAADTVLPNNGIVEFIYDGSYWREM